ncbi:MAG TPA: DNA repair protein RecO [Actinomycetota bacterium]|nr:DNA repair protein RecO [Actinomycetota bacterium]
MPGLYKDEGIVLKTIKLGEADRIVTLFTRDNGKVRAVAKGIRKTKSRFGGRLEPFNRVELMIYRGRSLDTITAAHIVDAYDDVRRDLTRLTSASALVELVEKITPDRERAFSTYGLLIGGLRALAEDKGGTIVPAFLVKLLSVSGYHPELSVCAGCGEGGLLGGFSPALGGAVCQGCWHEDADSFAMTDDRLLLMRRLLQADFGLAAPDDVAGEITQALRRYAEYHLERPLRTLQMLRAV